MFPSRRTTLPRARAQETLVHTMVEDLPTAATSATASASASAVSTVVTDATVDAAPASSTGRSSVGARVVGVTACREFGSAAEVNDKDVESEPKIVDDKRPETKADEIAGGDSNEDGKGKNHHFGSTYVLSGR